ncbi:MAG: radical SAM protein [Eubacteriales bacterium]
MKDNLGRNIRYARISITDACNFSCTYCKTEEESGFYPVSITTEDILKIAKIWIELGIDSFKITGGEPTLHKDCLYLIEQLKKLGAEVTMTSNGSFSNTFLKQLGNSGLDALTISLNTLDSQQFQELSSSSVPLEQVLENVFLSTSFFKTKINCVLLSETKKQWIPLAKIAQNRPIDVRFIQPMPIGKAIHEKREATIPYFQKEWKDLQLAPEKKGNGPAIYYKTQELQGYLGFILPIEDKFCHLCNRIRLNSSGFLQSCLCYPEGGDLRKFMEENDSESALKAYIKKIIAEKPQAHCFETGKSKTKNMRQIGG